MTRRWSIAIGLVLGTSWLASSADAQWMYPRGYGGYGMSRWGVSPNAGFMAGLGSYARGQGVYKVDEAKADSINVDTMIKWNKALRARQAALRVEQQQQQAQQAAVDAANLAEMNLKNGATLNALLAQVLDADPAAVKASRTDVPLSAAAIREIPFEWDSEAITICLDQMTGDDALPVPLMEDQYAPERAALRAAVRPALAEDRAGSVSPATSKKIVEAVAAFRAKYLKNAGELSVQYQESLDTFTTLSSLTRLLNDPSMKAFLNQLEDGKEQTVGDLVAFMNAYNLRFGPATTERQVEIYRALAPALTALRDRVAAEVVTRTPPDTSGNALRAAAKEGFRSMDWDQLDAHARDPRN